jgi:carbonic anhydrase
MNGRQYDAELHIVHQMYDEEDEEVHEYAVVAILFDSTKDIEGGLLGKLKLQDIKLGANQTLANMTAANLTRGELLKVPLMQYIERMDKSFYYYEGSLTKPPCVETVKFVVMNEIQYITFSDMEQF